MKLNIYGLKDDVAGEFVFFWQAQNEGMMKRAIKGALLSKEQNPFTTDIKDKSVYELGAIDTLTGQLEAIAPIFCVRVSEVRLELIKEIKIAKAEAGVAEPNAEEVAKDE